jgi:hypothetical protein
MQPRLLGELQSVHNGLDSALNLVFNSLGNQTLWLSMESVAI